MRRERWRQGDERGPQKDVRLRPEARELERQTQGRWGGGDKTGGGKVGTSRVEKEEDEETAGGEKKERKRERRIQRREATG